MRHFLYTIHIQLIILSKVIYIDSLTFAVNTRGQSRDDLFRRFSSESGAADETKPKAEYGVSYIGGDPCGSKYNSDPFDTKVTKPGMPDDMKARIQALAEKKMQKATDKEKRN